MTLAHFHDTVGIGRVEREAESQANQRQESRILDFFRAHPDQTFSREAIELRFGIKAPSASRALADLTAAGRLERTQERIKSSAGKTAGTWRLAQWRPAPVVQEALF